MLHPLTNDAAFLSGGSTMGARVRAFDWALTPLGPPGSWPQPLKTLMGVLLAANQPMFIAWGEVRTLLYNDAYGEILGDKHPDALGRDFLDVWREIREDLLPIVRQALAGEPVHMGDITLTVHRRGYPEETHFAFSYTPVRDETGTIAGFFCACTETTGQILAERRLVAETERQRHLFQRAPGFITILRGPDHVFEFVNDTYARLFGDRDFVGKTARDAFPELDGQGFFELLDGVFTTGERFVAHEIPIRLRPSPEMAEEEHFLDFIYEPVIDELNQVTGIFCEGHDVTDAYLARQALRATGRRQEFRLALEARLRDIVHPAEIIAAASEALGNYLSAGQVAYAEVDASAEFVTVVRDWSDGSLIGVEGRHRMDDYGPAFVAELKNGVTVAIADVRLDPRTSSREALASFEAISLRAFINVAVIKEGRLVAILAVHSGNARTWSAEEVALAEEIAERTWAAAAQARAEGELRQSEERNRRIVEGLRDYSVFTTNAQDVVVDWTKGAAAVFGWSADEIVGMNAEVLYTPEDRAAGAPADELATAREAGCANDERWHVRQDGSRFFANGSVRPLHGAHGEVTGFIKIARDETERRAVDARLRASEEFNRRILASSADCIKVLDLDAHLEFMSEGGMRAMEVDDFSAIEGACWPDFWKGEKHTEVLAAVEEAKTGRTGRVQGFATTIKGSPRWWDVIVTPITGADGRPEKLLSISRDVTATKQGEVRLRELNETLEERVAERTADLLQAQEALRQSQKMEAMGQLTGGVAHDFNNLLSPIVGTLDMLQRRGIGGEREKRLIDGAAQSAERARTLVQRLLAFARRQPLQPSAVDIAGLISGMADLIASTTGPQIKVVVDAPADLPTAKADPNQLEMAILNLSVNARDAMAEGGTLRISGAAETIGRNNRAGLTPGPYVRLSVADTGVGMDEATVARAIEPFFSTKGVGKGTGLGLSMVHGLASQLGGALSITSKPGLGTNVELWLPVADAPAFHVESSAPGVLEPARLGTALLVDDEELVRASTADMLTDLGYDVSEAGSAEEALRLLNQGLSPDLVITDHLMPGMSGTDLARIVQDTRPGTTVLIVSGYSESEGIAPDLPRLTKPFRQVDLAASLAKLSAGEKRAGTSYQ